MLDGGDVIARFEQSLRRAGVEPRHAAAKQLHMQFVALKIQQIQIGNLELPARRWPQHATTFDDFVVVNIKPGHGEMALRLFWFFLEANGFAFGVELDYAVALRVANLITKNKCPTLDSERVTVEVEFAVENIVAKNQRCAGVADKFCGDQKGLRDTLGFRLGGVLNANTELRAIAE